MLTTFSEDTASAKKSQFQSLSKHFNAAETHVMFTSTVEASPPAIDTKDLANNSVALQYIGHIYERYIFEYRTAYTHLITDNSEMYVELS